jgi:hypothetical protein
VLGINGLVALAIAEGIRPLDIRREGDVADAIESGEEVVVLTLGGLKADVALAEFPSAQDLGLQFAEIAIALAKEQAFADADLAAGPNQTFPIVGLGVELVAEQNLDAAGEDIAGAFAASIEPRWKDAGVVENQQIAGLQQVRKVAEPAVGMAAAGSLQIEHAGFVASGEGFLGNEVVGKMEVEVGNQHGVRL